MSKLLSYAAMAAVLSLAGPALAQSAQPAAKSAPPTTSSPSSAAPAATAPSATPPTTSAPAEAAPPAAAAATGGDAAANAGAEVTNGMSVKDNTGALIGLVTGVKNGMATIKMGSDTFTVETSKLGVAGGAATINATQADIKKMLPKK